jgi:hypothetical protein
MKKKKKTPGYLSRSFHSWKETFKRQPILQEFQEQKQKCYGEFDGEKKLIMKH